MAVVAGNLKNSVEFERAYDRYSSRVYASALRVLRDPARAEDVTQDVFLRLWSDPSRYDPKRGGLATYLQLMAHSAPRMSADATAKRCGVVKKRCSHQTAPTIKATHGRY